MAGCADQFQIPKIWRGKKDMDGQSILKTPLATLVIPRCAEYDVNRQSRCSGYGISEAVHRPQCIVGSWTQLGDGGQIDRGA
jgi:hypothetical protein